MWYSKYFGSVPLPGGKMTRTKLAKFENNIEFQNTFEKYFTLAMDLFEWENLPETCDGRMLERCLLSTGQAMIAQVDGAYLTLGAASGGGINLYGYPTRGYGWGWNGFNRQFDLFVPGADESRLVVQSSDGRSVEQQPEAVVCYDNVNAFPYVNYIFSYAKRLSDLLRSCDVTSKNLKTPFIVACDETQVKSVKAAFDQIESNSALIISSGQISLDSLKVLQTGVGSDNLTALWEQYRNFEGELLETLGINSNNNTDKSERLLVDEVNANNDETQRNAQKRLRQRQIFCDRVNKCFGLDISVKFREGERAYVRESDNLTRIPNDNSADGPLFRDSD